MAETVNRLQAQPREHGGESLRALGEVELREQRRQRGEVFRRPAARQLAEQLAEAARHLGRGGVGEGDGDRALGDARGDLGRLCGHVCRDRRRTGGAPRAPLRQPPNLGPGARSPVGPPASASCRCRRRPRARPDDELADREIASGLIGERARRESNRGSRTLRVGVAPGRGLAQLEEPPGGLARPRSAARPHGSGISAGGLRVASAERTQRSSRRRAPLSPCRQATRTSQ